MKLVSLTGTNGTIVWTLSRESESQPWHLGDSKSGEVLDTTNAAQTIEVLNFLGFVDVSRAVPGQTGFEQAMSLSVETFDHFFYTLKITIPPKHETTYQVAIGVRAEIASERIGSAGKAPDQQKMLSEEFQAHAKTLRDKLARESRFGDGGWIYVMESTMIDPLISDRASLLANKSLADVKKIP